MAQITIVAEVAQAHEGSLSLAHAYIDLVADAGCDAVKFQCHIAAAESTPAEVWRQIPRWTQDATRYAYWRRMEFTPEQWFGLAGHCRDRSIEFLVTPFSPEAVRGLDRYVSRWKIGSADVRNTALLDAVELTGKSVIASTGLATWDDIEQLVKRFSRLTLLQCTTGYPTSFEDVGLPMLKQMRRSGVKTGLSDHTGTIWPSIAAATLGASMLEVHVTFSKAMQGLDTAASLDPTQLRQLVEGVRAIERMREFEAEYDKDATTARLKETSVVAYTAGRVHPRNL